METFAPILGMTMMVLGLMMLLFSLGLLIWYYWPRLTNAAGRNKTAPDAPPSNQSKDSGP